MVSFGSQVDFSLPHIKIRGLNKFYQSQGQKLHALKEINLDIPQGKILGIIGKSGAGKSSLLRTLNGLEQVNTGSIHIHQQNIAELSHAELIQTRQRIGMIFQHFNLMSAKTVWENVALPLKVSNYNKADIDQRVNEVLALVGLADKSNYYPHNFLEDKSNVLVLHAHLFTTQKFYCVTRQPRHLIQKVLPLFWLCLKRLIRSWVSPLY